MLTCRKLNLKISLLSAVLLRKKGLCLKTACGELCMVNNIGYEKFSYDTLVY